jgi:hypothetical protein
MKWEQIASRIDAEYISDIDLKKDFGFFNLWDWGTGRYSKIIGGLRKKTQDIDVIVADYEYEHARNMHVPGPLGILRGITFCLVKSPNLSLPQLNVRSETPLYNVVKRVSGSYSVVFDKFPEFTSAFEVQGDSALAHQVFTENICNIFLSKFRTANLRLEMHDDMFMFHYGVLTAPEESRVMLIDAVDLLIAFGGKAIDYNAPTYDKYI